MSKLGVLFFAGDRSGSTFYRILQPAQKLAQYDLCQIGICYPWDSPELKVEAQKASDILVFFSSSSPNLAEQFYEIRKAGKKIVMDMNDDIFNVSPYSIHYKTFGTKEAVHCTSEGEFLKFWEDGKNIHIEANKQNLENHKEVLRSVDLITVTTPYLAELYSEFNRTVVLPDMVDLQILKPLWVTYPEDAFRLGWRGGESHYEDLMYVQKPLEHLIEAHHNLKLIMSGFCPKSLVTNIPKNRLEVYPFFGHPAFEWHLMALGCHATFYPWADISFNQAKNNLCWQQWSALEIAGVYPSMPPYTDHVIHGETAMIAGSKEGYFDCINRLILDKPLRRRIARAARREVEEHWDVNKGIIQYKEAYETLWNSTNLPTSRDSDISGVVYH